MYRILKKLLEVAPTSCHDDLRRMYFRSQIRGDTFDIPDPEFRLLDRLLRPGDWAIDVGANIGHYTKKCSDLVGVEGRVIAVEPVPTTFAILASNVAAFRFPNVTLLNVAASQCNSTLGISIPKSETGTEKNFYQAAVTQGMSDFRVVALQLDSLSLEHPVRLIKIDAEGHDSNVIDGLRRTLQRDHPIIVIESTSAECTSLLHSFGYMRTDLPKSPNSIWATTALDLGNR